MEPKWNRNGTKILKKGTEVEPKLIKMEPEWNQNTKLYTISCQNEVPHSYNLTQWHPKGPRVDVSWPTCWENTDMRLDCAGRARIACRARSDRSKRDPFGGGRWPEAQRNAMQCNVA